MPNNRFKPRQAYQKPAINRTAALYAGYIARGIVLIPRNGEIDIQTPDGKVTDMLRRQVEQNKEALLAHMATLPPKSWSDVGRADDFDEVKELGF